MVHAADILSTDNELFRTYLFYSCLLMLKVCGLVALIALQRVTRKVFANPEDASVLGVKPTIDENVERSRRAHLNDLESIPVFLIVSFAYILTNPALETTTMLFRIFTAARYLHTLVYAVWVIPQPARSISFEVGFMITIYMTVKSIFYFM